MSGDGKIRVLIVDDSAIARDMLEQGLTRNPDIAVVGKASDAFSARDKIVLTRPDVVTLDIEMPRMDGIEFLKRLLPQYPIPVVVVSAVTLEGSRRALEALEAGAVDVVAKPDAGNREGLARMLADLAERVKEAAGADVSKLSAARRGYRHHETPQPKSARLQSKNRATAGSGSRIIAIGASTGGTCALNTIVPQFPEDIPGVVIVQHMPPVFTRMFAESLNRDSRVEVREAKDGDLIRPGLVLVAPGDLHLSVRRYGIEWRVECAHGDKVSGHRPSVDVLFNSVAESAGPRAIGLLLTGMGRDGADGLLAMRRAGARCFTQDEESSVVYGMPKEAWDNGASERQLPLGVATAALLACLSARVPAGG